MCHQVGNYTLRNPSPRRVNHAMALGISTLCCLYHYSETLEMLPLGMSVQCEGKGISSVTLYTALRVLQQGIWLRFTTADNTSWMHHCHFKKQYCPGTSSSQTMKWGTDDKHTANRWHIHRWNHIIFYRRAHIKNRLYSAIQTMFN